MSHVDDGQLNALLDGELDAEERSTVEGHLAACRICRDRLEEARAFLIESGSLLEKLDAQAHERTSAQKPGKTAREKAIELALPPSKTLREPAINIDGQTAKAAPSPFFPQAAERIAAEAGRDLQAREEAAKEEARARRRAKWGDVSQLAWAASIVLAIGVGFLTNEVMNLRDEQARLSNTDLATSRSVSQVAADTAKAPALADAAAEARGGAGAASGAPLRTGTRTTGTPRTTLVKPPEQRGAAKPPDVTGELNIPLDRRDAQRQGRAEEMAGVASADRVERALNQPQRPAAAAPAPAPLAAAPMPPSATPQPSAPGDAAAGPPAPAANRAAGAAGQPRGFAARESPAVFHRINADSAIRALSGSIRLVDGMRPGSIELGRGYLVPGANPDRDVVRIHYQDSLGRRLVLDQQPGDGGVTGASVNGLMRGDTLITSAPSGGLRVRWVDRKNFWLSLTGPLTPEELRTLVERIR